MAIHFLSKEEQKKRDERDRKILSILKQKLFGKEGEIPLSYVFSFYIKNKGVFCNYSKYNIPTDLTPNVPLKLKDIPVSCDFPIVETELERNYDIAHIFSNLYLNFEQAYGEWKWFRSVKILDLIYDEIPYQLPGRYDFPNGNINVILKNFIKEKGDKLSFSDFVNKTILTINENVISFQEKKYNILVPYSDNPSLSHNAELCLYSCNTINPINVIQQFNGLKSDSIEYYFKSYKIASTSFDDFIVDIWYNKNIMFWDRKKWLSNLFLITKKGFFIPVSDIIKDENKNYSDSIDITQPYSVFLGGALRMTFCFAFNSEPDSNPTKGALKYLLNLLKDYKITIIKGVAGYDFLFSLPYYSWI